MTISDLLDATKPIIYETGVEEYPYALSGTCYPVRYHRNLFVVSAFHCYKNFNIEPEQTLYPRPANPTEFFALDRWFRAHAAESKDDEHYDQIVLRIARTDHSDSEIAQVAALDLAIPTNARLPTGSNIKDFLIRGYPFGAPGHYVDYDTQKISQQAYCTNGCLGVSKAPFDHCYSIRMLAPIPHGMNPNGMSGTPVYGVTCDSRPVYCGTIIRYGEVSKEYLAIGPEVLVNCLRQIRTG